MYELLTHEALDRRRSKACTWEDVSMPNLKPRPIKALPDSAVLARLREWQCDRDCECMANKKGISLFLTLALQVRCELLTPGAALTDCCQAIGRLATDDVNAAASRLLYKESLSRLMRQAMQSEVLPQVLILDRVEALGTKAEARGGFGEVWKANLRDGISSRRVAVKIMYGAAAQEKNKRVCQNSF